MTGLIRNTRKGPLSIHLHSCLKITFVVLISAPLLLPAKDAKEAKPDAANQAWAALQAAQQPLLPPEEWHTRSVTADDHEKFRKALRDRAVAINELASDFNKNFPDHPAREQLRMIQFGALQNAVGLSDSLKETTPANETKKLEQALENAAIKGNERLNIQWELAVRRALDKQKLGNAAVAEELERGARSLQKDFPGEPEIDQLLLLAAQRGNAVTSARLSADILNGNGSSRAKREAQGLVAQVAAKVRPVEMELNTIDRRKIKLDSLKGKVVLLYFWDTASLGKGQRLDLIKQAYEKYHSQGLEVISINFDPTDAVIKEIVQKETIPWPQVFDGFPSGGPPWQKYGIRSLPTVWLIDQKGLLREQDVGSDLAKTVENILAKP